MALILNIDTAIDAASVCLARDAKTIAFARNEKPKDHASWLQPVIRDLFLETKLTLDEVEAVSVTSGPGSYTGLRIGLATAKGICYALNKPLITLNTLMVMAAAVINENTKLLCPMIDARRMEVFTAVYNKELRAVIPPAAIVLNDKSFEAELRADTICFLGNGSRKFKDLQKNPNAFFSELNYDASTMIQLSEKKFQDQDFADLAYAEPLYLKEFFTPSIK